MVEPLTDCPGIKHKLQLQPHGSSKHQAEIDLVSPPKIPCYAEKSKINPARSPDAQRAEDLTKSPPSQSSDIHPTATAQSKSQKSKGKSHLAPVPLDLSNKAGSVGPPLKSIIWPCDFSVSQIYSPSDMDFVPISQCPWCNLEIPTDFEPLATLLHSVRNS